MSFLQDISVVSQVIAFAPLVGAIIVGLGGKLISRAAAHWITILAVAVSTVLSFYLFNLFTSLEEESIEFTLYRWIDTGSVQLQVGFLLDNLSLSMMMVVSFVSLMVHIYTIGYMHDDPGYNRFFAYISLFTFAMLMLVMANNFLQLFFGWEAVGLVSYLLIGFWYKKETAIFANLKAFLVNRVGDFGFLLGIAAVFMYFNTLDYATVFEMAPYLKDATIRIFSGESWPVMTFICICLFIGAMGKSAQVPLHVWLPDSMEGPTPISALIHAATMVTAGIFMVCRMSPLFELSEVALNFILIIGSVTALFMGLLGIVQNDIKRVVAYSTLSQLGYMTVALGASAYAASMFHLITHAFFKALLFLAAGSVIIGMHHEQDMRKMGGLFRYMPITWVTCFIGTLALIGFPGTSGFYSKDSIIEAVHYSQLPASNLAYYALLAGVFITAFYSFRLFFMVFHGKERMDKTSWEHLHESPAVVYIPLIILSIPSLVLGYLSIETFLVSDYFSSSIHVAAEHTALQSFTEHFHGPFSMIVHSIVESPKVLILLLLGTAAAWYCYCVNTALPEYIASKFKWLHTILLNKYGFDDLYQCLFAGGSRNIGRLFWSLMDMKLIDGLLINGSANFIGKSSRIIRKIQTGRLYDYVFFMIFAVLILLAVFVHRILS